MHAYVGAAYATLAFWNEQDKSLEPLRNSALEEFRAARALQPNFRFPEALVSPRIIRLFERRRPEVTTQLEPTVFAPALSNLAVPPQTRAAARQPRPAGEPPPRPPAPRSGVDQPDDGLATLSGNVVGDWFRPITGAQVAVSEMGSDHVYITYTDARGEFSHPVAVPGKYRITASKNGRSQSFIVDVKDRNNSRLTFALLPRKEPKQ
jgi:hypothetical protein